MEKYLSPVFGVFQRELTSESSILGSALKNFILALLWFVHNLQFWLILLMTGLDRQIRTFLPTSPVNNDEDCQQVRDPSFWAMRVISMLLYASNLLFFRLYFRFTQLVYLIVLCVYINLGFKEPVPLVVLDGVNKNFYI